MFVTSYLIFTLFVFLLILFTENDDGNKNSIRASLIISICWPLVSMMLISVLLFIFCLGIILFLLSLFAKF